VGLESVGEFPEKARRIRYLVNNEEREDEVNLADQPGETWTLRLRQPEVEPVRQVGLRGDDAVIRVPGGASPWAGEDRRSSPIAA